MKPIAFLSLALLALHLHAAGTNALTFVKPIYMLHVDGSIGHFDLDAKGKRLFVAAYGNGTVEVIDLAGSKHVGTIGNCFSPRGVAFIPAKNRLAIANAGNGTLKFLDSTSFTTLSSAASTPGADNMHYDAKADLLYVGYDGALGIFQGTSGDPVATINLPGHPASFQLEQDGSRIFVNLPESQKVVVIDRVTREIVESWPMNPSHDNYAMALDEANHRLFIGFRQPARLVVLDSLTGDKITDVDISGDIDDLFYDASRKQIYASCGAGFIDVITQSTPDTYELKERITTPKEARTSYFSPERGELYLAVPGNMMSARAEIRVFKCSP